LFLRTATESLVWLIVYNKPKMAYSRDLADMDYHRLSWTIMDCLEKSLTVMDCNGLLSWIIIDCHGLSWTILDWI